MSLSFNVKNYFSSSAADTSSTNSLNQLVVNNTNGIKLQDKSPHTSTRKMDDSSSDLDTNQILRSDRQNDRANYSSIDTNNIVYEAASSQASLAPALFKQDDLLKSKRKLITVCVLFVLNLINYVDRFTVAGK